MAEPFIGEVDLYGFSFVPENWAQCDGATQLISANQALYSLIGTAFGGDGRTTFALPDLRGKIAVSQGNFPGSNFDWKVGQTRGVEAHTMTLNEMPQHSHTATFTGSAAAPVDVQVSTDVATQDTATNGCYLAKNDGGRNPGVFIYRPNAGAASVPLGGVSGGGGIAGSVTLDNSGASQAFNLIQASLVANYCMAMFGLFPSRN